MTPQQILQYVREASQVRVAELDDDYIYDRMTQEYQTLWQEITLLDKNYGVSFRDTNVIANNNIYPLLMPVEKTASNTAVPGQLKINKITVKYKDTDQYPVVAQFKDFDFMERPKERYEENQSVYNPFYIVSDNNVYLYPKPKDTIVGGLTMYGTKRPYALNQYTTNVSDILLEREYHDLIALGTTIHVYRKRQKFDVAQEAEAYYNRMKTEMMNNIRTRVLQPMRGNIPSLLTPDMMYFGSNR